MLAAAAPHSLQVAKHIRACPHLIMRKILRNRALMRNVGYNQSFGHAYTEVFGSIRDSAEQREGDRCGERESCIPDINSLGFINQKSICRYAGDGSRTREHLRDRTLNPAPLTRAASEIFDFFAARRFLTIFTAASSLFWPIRI